MNNQKPTIKDILIIVLCVVAVVLLGLFGKLNAQLVGNLYIQDLNCNGVKDTIDINDYNSVPSYLKCGNNKILIIHVHNNKELCVGFSSLKAHLNHGDSLPVDCSLLPIELGYSNIDVKENNIVVEWSTFAEINNSHFEIQYSYDFSIWETSNIVKGAGYSSYELQYYSEIQNLKDGEIYVRLKQVDFNKETEYYYLGVVEINNEKNENWTSYEIYSIGGDLIVKGRYEDIKVVKGLSFVVLKNENEFKSYKQFVQ